MMTADAPQGGSELTLSLDEMMDYAITSQRANNFGMAESLYKTILERLPDDAAALHYYGVLNHQRGDSKTALQLIERSLALEPERADFWNNYGNILTTLNRLDEAIDALKKSAELSPNAAEAFNNLGVIQRKKRNLETAASCFARAIELRPLYAEALMNFSSLRIAQNRIPEAADLSFRAFTLMPQNMKTRRQLGYVYGRLGEVEKARGVYQKWLADEPDNPVPKHHLMALGGTAPPRASDDYVRNIFDSFAGSFDTVLGRLEYRAPEYCAAAVSAWAGVPSASLLVLDAGCGTGLCGPMLRPFAANLAGVDLSPKMVDQARQRTGYDSLAVDELTGFLIAHPSAYDLIVSADTLCYFGDLTDVFAAAAASLRGAGALVFTVELNSESTAPFHLFRHGRYGHREDYVREALLRHRLMADVITPVVLRLEAGTPVNGLVVTAKKAV